MKKVVVCFGDSLTWGYNPNPVSRHPYEVRWPSVLEQELSDHIRVIQEGLNGRKTMYDDKSVVEDRNGLNTLPVVLATHKPIDLLIILLGTNDLKKDQPGSVLHAKEGIRKLIQFANGFLYKYDFKAPKILVISPPHLENTPNPFFDIFRDALEDSKNFDQFYQEVAQSEGCYFFNASSVCKADQTDGVHLDAENTIALGQAISQQVRKIFSIKE